MPQDEGARRDENDNRPDDAGGQWVVAAAEIEACQDEKCRSRADSHGRGLLVVDRHHKARTARRDARHRGTGESAKPGALDADRRSPACGAVKRRESAETARGYRVESATSSQHSDVLRSRLPSLPVTAGGSRVTATARLGWYARRLARMGLRKRLDHARRLGCSPNGCRRVERRPTRVEASAGSRHLRVFSPATPFSGSRSVS